MLFCHQEESDVALWEQSVFGVFILLERNYRTIWGERKKKMSVLSIHGLRKIL